MKKFLSTLLALSMVFALAGCGNSSEPESSPSASAPEVSDSAAPTEEVELIVFAAASMTETLTEISELYKEVAPNVTLTFNFDSSGKLKTQIEEGADCDVFISAAQLQMNQLDSAADPSVNTDRAGLRPSGHPLQPAGEQGGPDGA